MLTPFLIFGLASLATASSAITLSKGAIFAPLRKWATAHSTWGGKLLSCTYCVTHWSALFWVLLGGVGGVLPLTSSIGGDYLITIFGVITMATIFEGIMARLLLMHEQQLEEVKEQTMEMVETLKKTAQEAVEEYKASYAKKQEGKETNDTTAGAVPWVHKEIRRDVVGPDFTKIFSDTAQRKQKKRTVS